MLGAALDWLFDVLVERGLLSLGARLIWIARSRRRSLDEQMEHTLPNLLVGALVWAAVIAVVLALL
jgi:hypothetical protein